MLNHCAVVTMKNGEKLFYQREDASLYAGFMRDFIYKSNGSMGFALSLNDVLTGNSSLFAIRQYEEVRDIQFFGVTVFFAGQDDNGEQILEARFIGGPDLPDHYAEIHLKNGKSIFKTYNTPQEYAALSQAYEGKQTLATPAFISVEELIRRNANFITINFDDVAYISYHNVSVARNNTNGFMGF